MQHLPIIIVAGATASGKSALAIAIAEKQNGVIINADSQQMYAELRVLTARPTPEEEARVPHALYGVLRASEPCSAGEWLRRARMEIDWARSSGKTPVVVGGTGLYIRALMQGIAEIPPIAPEVCAQARGDFEAMGREAFHARLSEVDPAIAARLRVSDTQRVLRAYEVWLGTGRRFSAWQEDGLKPIYDNTLFEVIKVERERAELYARCDVRLKMMVEEGALEEVRALLAQNLPPEAPAMRIIGVPEFGAYLRGETSLEEALARAQQATRNYAKRQLTWFRHQLKG